MRVDKPERGTCACVQQKDQTPYTYLRVSISPSAARARVCNKRIKQPTPTFASLLRCWLSAEAMSEAVPVPRKRPARVCARMCVCACACARSRVRVV